MPIDAVTNAAVVSQPLSRMAESDRAENKVLTLGIFMALPGHERNFGQSRLEAPFFHDRGKDSVSVWLAAAIGPQSRGNNRR